MVPALLVAALLIASYAAARVWLRKAGPVNPREQVDAFTRARAVTNRWAQDPSATPAPLKEYLARSKPLDGS